MQGRRRHRDDEGDERLVRRRVARQVAQEPARHAVLGDVAVDYWIHSFSSESAILQAWEMEGLGCVCPEMMSRLLFACMSGAVEMPGRVQDYIQYTLDPVHDVLHGPRLDAFVERPIRNRFDLPEGHEVVISVRQGEEWIDWVRVARHGLSFRCFACREFLRNEIVFVFAGDSVWRSGVPYEDCRVAGELSGVRQRQGPLGYCRARDGMIQVLDSSDTHMLLGGSLCRTAAEGGRPNVHMRDSGDYYATKMIRHGHEIVHSGD